MDPPESNETMYKVQGARSNSYLAIYRRVSKVYIRATLIPARVKVVVVSFMQPTAE
jgi:hypothetical protein